MYKHIHILHMYIIHLHVQVVEIVWIEEIHVFVGILSHLKTAHITDGGHETVGGE